MASEHPRRRRRDRVCGKLEWLWHNGVPAIAIVLAAVAVVGNTSKIERQAEGRVVAVNVTCAAMSAVIDAGRTTIAGSGNQLPPKLERNLERLGYPSSDERRRRAEANARAYARSIAVRVEKESGVNGLVRKDGTLNCERLGEASAAEKKP